MSRDRNEINQPTIAICVAVGILVMVGIASIYVTDTHYTAGEDGPANAAKQLSALGLSIAVGVAIVWIGYQRIAKFAYPLFIASLLLLLPLLVARLTHSTLGGFTPQRNGAYRWIRLPGIQIQPSECMKFAYVLALAWYLRYRTNYRTFTGFLWPIVLSIIPLGLVLVQPELGMTLLLIPVLLVMLFVAGAKWQHLLLVILAGIIVAPLTWSHIHDYQRRRVSAVLLQSDDLRKAIIANPEKYKAFADKRQAIEWAASSGYQLVHSKNAIGSGGWFGHGWGQGTYTENNLLPDRHNDFVFALVGHQWGLVGCLIVLACYGVIVVLGVRIASSTPEPSARLTSIGIVTLIGTQVIINVGMTIGVMPITGVTLPFVSYGGSSLVTNFAAIALLISVSQKRPYLLAVRPFHFGRRTERPHPTEKEATRPTSRENSEAGSFRTLDRN